MHWAAQVFRYMASMQQICFSYLIYPKNSIFLVLIYFTAKHNKIHLLTEISYNIMSKVPVSNITNLMIWKSNWYQILEARITQSL
jgi:hypothetical protein